MAAKSMKSKQVESVDFLLATARELKGRADLKKLSIKPQDYDFLCHEIGVIEQSLLPRKMSRSSTREYKMGAATAIRNLSYRIMRII